jgi:hypothetical protein
MGFAVRFMRKSTAGLLTDAQVARNYATLRQAWDAAKNDGCKLAFDASDEGYVWTVTNQQPSGDSSFTSSIILKPGETVTVEVKWNRDPDDEFKKALEKRLA